jgi:Ca2+-binding EF-hand superfamily protein
LKKTADELRYNLNEEESEEII